MATALKEIYSIDFIYNLSIILKKMVPSIKEQEFREAIFDKNWEALELKDRMAHIAKVLYQQIDQPYEETGKILLELVEVLEKVHNTGYNFEYMFLPSIVEQFGQDDFDTSITIMTRLTQYTSCEFAVRPFYIHYFDKMIQQTKLWAKHESYKVRRLASEGCRPRLPWAIAIPKLKKDPKEILPILEQLKDDSSEWVRRSVANSLNDIAKDHPNQVISLAKKWIGKSQHLDWVVKHACRTLLKQGNTEVMRLFGFLAPDYIKIGEFKLKNEKVQLGDYLNFSFKLKNTHKTASLLRLEYAIYYLKANGSHSKKVFKISEKEYAAESSQLIERRQHFKPISTRKHYAGKHKVALIVNGVEGKSLDFVLEV
ncbi:MAG: DNA alkylation repair protein [Saprospiraceae bacterium]|nr:DNA alkylation repair protein [Saprospiraceae bacterium]